MEIKKKKKKQRLRSALLGFRNGIRVMGVRKLRSTDMGVSMGG